MAEKVQPYLQVFQNKSFKRIATSNFIGGIFWALGVTIGFSVLVALLTLFSKYIDVVPVVGSFVSDVIDFVLSYNKTFR